MTTCNVGVSGNLAHSLFYTSEQSAMAVGAAGVGSTANPSYRKFPAVSQVKGTVLGEANKLASS